MKPEDYIASYLDETGLLIERIKGRCCTTLTA